MPAACVGETACLSGHAAWVIHDAMAKVVHRDGLSRGSLDPDVAAALDALARAAFAHERSRDGAARGAAPSRHGATLTTQQVAERLGLTPARVGQLARTRALPHHRHGRFYLFAECDVAEFERGRKR